MRLDKYLSDAGAASRKELRTIIRAGRVSVNGTVAVSPDMKIKEGTDLIVLDGKSVIYDPVIVVMMNKPDGYVTSVSDRKEKTVMEMIPKELYRPELVPIGRLDKETEGLLLFTNDGMLLHHLISPSHEIEKEYLAEHDGTVSDADILAFQDGIILKDGTACKPAQLKPIAPGKSMIVVQEGKYHQVRRMMASRSLYVRNLKRIREGSLTLGELKPGECRRLSEQEVEGLRKA